MTKLYSCMMAMALMSATCHATSLPASDTSGPIQTGAEMIIKKPVGNEPLYISEMTDIKSGPGLTARKIASSQTHNVTLRQVYDKELYECTDIVRIIGDDFYLGVQTFSDDETETISLPEGTYTFLSEFALLDENVFLAGIRCNAYILIENVTVDKDLSIEFKAEEAVNLITCESRNPDGEVPMLPGTRFTPDGPEKIDDNITYLTIENHFSSKKYGWIYGRNINGNFCQINENNGSSFNVSRLSDILINNVSDDIRITQSRLASAHDGFYFSFMKPIEGVSESCEGEYPDEYSVTHQEHCQPSILSENSQEKYPAPYFISVASNFGWIMSSSQTIESESGLLQIAGAHYLPDDFQLFFRPAYADLFTSDGLIYMIKSMPLCLSSDGSFTRIYEQHSDSFKKTAIQWDTTPPMQHPAFSYDEKQSVLTIGGSQPSILFESYREYNDLENRWDWYVNALPMGRLGEFRISDIMSIDKTETWKDGKLTHSVSTQNVDIYDSPDGTGNHFPGMTTASFTLNPEVSVDIPTLQQIQFRDQENLVTDRFKTQEEGSILIAAGGFSQKFSDTDISHWWFENYDAIISVYCSPMGENIWEEIYVEEDESRFVGQFGSFYHGSLASVSEKSPSGWYDLQISLSDSNGSTQTQVISPAFRIDHLTSASTTPSGSLRILYSNRVITVPGYPEAEIKVSGADGHTVCSASGSIDISSFPAGIYVVTVRNDSESIVKKVIV